VGTRIATQTAWKLQPTFFYPYETTPELPQLQTSPDSITQQPPDDQGDEAHTPDDPFESSVSADGESVTETTFLHKQ